MKRFYERYKLAVDLAVVSFVLVLFVFAGAHVTLTTSRVVEKEIAPALTKTAEKAASALEELSSAEAAEDYPSFTLAWSEYPSWSTFGVAHEVGIINGEKGKLGPIEKKWGVDIVAELEKLPGEGCAILRWNDRPVSLICFDAGNDRDLFLFVINTFISKE